MLRHGRSAGAGLALATALLVLPGCYGYTQYAPERPAPGLEIEATLNDRGRIAMENRIGPEVLTIEGTVFATSDSVFQMRVRRVVGLDRQVSTWSGEPVAIRTEHVRSMRERRFSAGRTALFVGAVTSSAIAFIVTRSIIGFGTGGQDPPIGPGQPPPEN